MCIWGEGAAKLLLPLLGELPRQAPSGVSFKWHLLCKWHWHSSWDVGSGSSSLVPPRVPWRRACSKELLLPAGAAGAAWGGEWALFSSWCFSLPFVSPEDLGFYFCVSPVSAAPGVCWPYLQTPLAKHGARVDGWCLNNWSSEEQDNRAELPKIAAQSVCTDPLRDQKFILGNAQLC